MTRDQAALTNPHGVVIRCQKYPLMPGDTLELFGSQVRGTYSGSPHFAVPGEYIVHSLPSPYEVNLESVASGELFRCGCSELRGALGEWSKYTKGEIGERMALCDFDRPAYTGRGNVVGEVTLGESEVEHLYDGSVLGSDYTDDESENLSFGQKIIAGLARFCRRL